MLSGRHLESKPRYVLVPRSFPYSALPPFKGCPIGQRCIQVEIFFHNDAIGEGVVSLSEMPKIDFCRDGSHLCRRCHLLSAGRRKPQPRDFVQIFSEAIQTPGASGSPACGHLTSNGLIEAVCRCVRAIAVMVYPGIRAKPQHASMKGDSKPLKEVKNTCWLILQDFHYQAFV